VRGEKKAMKFDNKPPQKEARGFGGGGGGFGRSRGGDRDDFNGNRGGYRKKSGGWNRDGDNDRGYNKPSRGGRGRGGFRGGYDRDRDGGDRDYGFNNRRGGRGRGGFRGDRPRRDFDKPRFESNVSDAKLNDRFGFGDDSWGSGVRTFKNSKK
jgi:hypothetical protein